ncbi:MAG: 2-succinyl-6-hydroxy-2,4-cyclohexadiene-1-carboxylate synthase [Anaerolinea sp.]|nr:2-succinyl-6-hydroxy-2,4-cyclohexadiene-1-carboxylate synthase [Anaerolinea sp.]
MPTIKVNGAHYQIESRGEGEPLLLLHGFTGAAANWRPLMSVLASSCRVIAVDLLGHGQSEIPSAPERYQMPFAAADLAALVTQIEATPCHLLGYSMGGRLALYVAVHYPHLVRTLILENASPGLRTPEERQMRQSSDEALAHRIETEGIESFVRYWEALPLFSTQSPEIRAALRPQRLRNSPLGLANSLRGMGTGVQPSLWEALPHIQIPTLILTGALDPKFKDIGAQMAALMPTSTQVILPNGGHTLHLEQPSQVVAVLERWLNPVTRG